MKEINVFDKLCTNLNVTVVSVTICLRREWINWNIITHRSSTNMSISITASYRSVTFNTLQSIDMLIHSGNVHIELFADLSLLKPQ